MEEDKEQINSELRTCREAAEAVRSFQESLLAKFRADEMEKERAMYAAAAQQRERERLHKRCSRDPMKLSFKVG